MSAQLIDGKRIAAEIFKTVKAAAQKLTASTGVVPGIAVIIIGDDPASQVYVNAKGSKAEECGLHSITHQLPEGTSQAELLAIIEMLNDDAAIHGILVQLPLPGYIDEGKIIQAISPQKDVDGFNFINVGKLATGKTTNALIPCTPAGSMVLIARALGTGDFSGLNAVVVGRSNIVGKPMANLLLAANATVTIVHSKTRNIEAICANADILVSAVGRPEMIKANWIKPGACVIDVGINRIDAPEKAQGKTRLVGDVDFQDASQTAGYITPVPGGVGPMTIAMLMANTLTSACRHAGVEPPRF